MHHACMYMPISFTPIHVLDHACMLRNPGTTTPTRQSSSPDIGKDSEPKLMHSLAYIQTYIQPSQTASPTIEPNSTEINPRCAVQATHERRALARSSYRRERKNLTDRQTDRQTDYNRERGRKRGGKKGERSIAYTPPIYIHPQSTPKMCVYLLILLSLSLSLPSTPIPTLPQHLLHSPPHNPQSIPPLPILPTRPHGPEIPRLRHNSQHIRQSQRIFRPPERLLLPPRRNEPLLDNHNEPLSQ